MLQLCCRYSYVFSSLCGIYFFFFSSRRRHTRCYRDWSSDVCSSDLRRRRARRRSRRGGRARAPEPGRRRSEERRVGKECRYRWARTQQKKEKLHCRGQNVKGGSGYMTIESNKRYSV